MWYLSRVFVPGVRVTKHTSSRIVINRAILHAPIATPLYNPCRATRDHRKLQTASEFSARLQNSPYGLIITKSAPLDGNGLVLVGGSRPSAYVGIVGLRVWTPTGELGISIPRGSRPSNRVGIVETYNYKHEIVLLA